MRVLEWTKNKIPDKKKINIDWSIHETSKNVKYF